MLDSSGDPIGSGTVTLYRQARDGSGEMRAVRSAYVQQGSPEYEFSDIPPGTYRLAVSATPWFASAAKQGSAPSALDQSYALTYFNNAANEADAQAVSVRPGEIVTANFSLRAVPSVHITARVAAQTASSKAYSIPYVSAAPFGQTLAVTTKWTETQAGADGRQDWIFSVAPGEYRIRDGDASFNVNASADVSLEAESALPTVPITGTVAMANGQALPPMLTLQLRTEAGKGRLAGTAGPVSRDQAPQTTPARDGSFALQAAQDGDYLIVLQGLGRYAVVGTAASGGTTSGNALHVTRKPVTLAATIAPAESSVVGVATNSKGEPEAGVMVVLAPEDGTAAHLYYEDETNSDGSWRVTDVAAGRYRAVAIRDGWDLAWKQPAVLSKYLVGGSVPVSVDGRSLTPVEQPVLVQGR